MFLASHMGDVRVPHRKPADAMPGHAPCPQHPAPASHSRGLIFLALRTCLDCTAQADVVLRIALAALGIALFVLVIELEARSSELKEPRLVAIVV